MFDVDIVELYSTFHFLKKEGGFSIEEIGELHPFELDIFYSLNMKDLKEKAKK